MKNIIYRTGQIQVFGDVLLDEMKLLVPRKMFDIGNVAGDQIVDGNDTVSFGK